MGLFTSLRKAFDDPAVEVAAPSVVLTPLPPPDPIVRCVGQALIRGITSICDVSYDDAWMRLYHLPIHSLALLDSPAGWICLAQQMGLPLE